MDARLRRTWVAAAAVAVLAAGCGGGGKDQGSSSSAVGSNSGTGSESSSNSGGSSASGNSGQLSKAEFTEQANAACAKQKQGAPARVQVYMKAHKSDGLKAEKLGQRAFNAAVLGTAEGEVSAVRALPPPQSESAQVDAMLSGEEAAIRKGWKGLSQLQLDEVEALFKATNKQERALGLSKCVKRT